MKIYVIKKEKIVNNQKICEVYRVGYKTYEEAKNKLLSEKYDIFYDVATDEERFIKNENEIIELADIKKVIV